eukprot:gnl/TRDRNA2_/TRDRNA2_174144_c0_seq1.p1 gnl/TRDRNA2_/TRDRNA2_174144_c0~~gnl/TRDRNA2_/TRDRNA2_174144_c0_seq1.p1  ORF type:complete len:450 (-),score=44.82 gnl/TRDRNA2_/TRDRNA2_174144_c0_seq1:224-1372(-)
MGEPPRSVHAILQEGLADINFGLRKCLIVRKALRYMKEGARHRRSRRLRVKLQATVRFCQLMTKIQKAKVGTPGWRGLLNSLMFLETPSSTSTVLKGLFEAMTPSGLSSKALPSPAGLPSPVGLFHAITPTAFSGRGPVAELRHQVVGVRKAEKKAKDVAAADAKEAQKSKKASPSIDGRPKRPKTQSSKRRGRPEVTTRRPPLMSDGTTSAPSKLFSSSRSAVPRKAALPLIFKKAVLKVVRQNRQLRLQRAARAANTPALALDSSSSMKTGSCDDNDNQMEIQIETEPATFKYTDEAASVMIAPPCQEGGPLFRRRWRFKRPPLASESESSQDILVEGCVPPGSRFAPSRPTGAPTFRSRWRQEEITTVGTQQAKSQDST